MPFFLTTPFYHTRTHNSIKTVYFALTWKFQKLIPPPAYSDEEINTLWSKLYEINNVDIILIMIYTGLRPTELLEIQTENVHLDEKYMVGGMQTEAGKDRIIPLNDKIMPLVKNRYDANKKYLINNKFGNHYTYGTYMNGNFYTCMGKLKMKHLPHDGKTA